MAVTKVSVSLPAELVEEARHERATGGLSGLLAQALEKELRLRRLRKALDSLDVLYGPPSQEAEEWAERVWKEASGSEPADS